MRRLKRSTALLQRSRNRLRGDTLSHGGSALRYKFSDNRVTHAQVLRLPAVAKRALARTKPRGRAASALQKASL
jgi:hypothetical protein